MMNTPKAILLAVTVLLFLITSSYPFIVFQLHGKLGFLSEKVERIFQWILFALWSVSLWTLGFPYNKLATADIRIFIIAFMAIVAATISFNDVAAHLDGRGNREEKLLYKNKMNKRRLILQRFHGAGAIGSDYYDTVCIYQLTDWVRYEEQFEKLRFDSSKWRIITTDL